MKHSWKVTAVLLIMFLATQLIGLAVIHAYASEEAVIPYGMEPPQDVKPEMSIVSIVVAFAIAITLVFFLTKIKAAIFLRIWFFVVVIIALGITLNSLFFYFKIPHPEIIAALIALPFAFYKIFKQNILVHNLTELLIYPGIAAVFVPILNVWTIILLLILISAYDIYAVWHSGFMQKMAKFQINHLKLFAGFFVPYMTRKQKQQVKQIKQKYKNQKNAEKVLKKKNIKVSLAILGGGDVIFPIIASGIFLIAYGLIPALIVTVCATLSLLGLFALAKKGKFYPAMPFISSGIFVGMIFAKLII